MATKEQIELIIVLMEAGLQQLEEKIENESRHYTRDDIARVRATCAKGEAIVEELEAALLPRPHAFVCNNCGWTGNELVYELPELDQLYERIEPGETVPAGECPECDALAHVNKSDWLG